MESQLRCSIPLAHSKIRLNRLGGQLHKVLGLSSEEFLLTDSRQLLCGTVCMCEAATPPAGQARLHIDLGSQLHGGPD